LIEWKKPTKFNVSNLESRFTELLNNWIDLKYNFRARLSTDEERIRELDCSTLDTRKGPLSKSVRNQCVPVRMAETKMMEKVKRATIGMHTFLVRM
jgi:hypothetical protein